jgi:hypothetical protein
VPEIEPETSGSVARNSTTRPQRRSSSAYNPTLNMETAVSLETSLAYTASWLNIPTCVVLRVRHNVHARSKISHLTESDEKYGSTNRYSQHLIVICPLEISSFVSLNSSQISLKSYYSLSDISLILPLLQKFIGVVRLNHIGGISRELM